MSARPIFPTIGPSSTWGAFDPSDPINQRCEAERKAATDYTLRRLKRPSIDQPALLAGMMCATVQVAIAMGIYNDEEKVLAGLHELLDFAWVQSQAMTTNGSRQ